MSERAYAVRRATADDAASLARLAEITFTETFGHLYPPEDLVSYVCSAYTANSCREMLADPRMARGALLAALHRRLVENHGAQRFHARYGFVKVGEYGFPVGKTVDRELILKR